MSSPQVTAEAVEEEVEEAGEVAKAAPLAPIQIRDNLDMPTLGRLLVASGYYKDAKSAAQAVVRVLAGQELGLGPLASMNNIYIVQERLSLSYQLIGALIKRSWNHDYRVVELTDTACRLEFFEKRDRDGEWESVGFSQFTMQDAQRAGLQQRSSAWKAYPRNLLFARALTNGARMHCPDVFVGGVYTREELE